MFSSSHNSFDFTEWYIFVGFSIFAAIVMAAYIKYLERLEGEQRDEKKQWKK